MLKKFTSKPFVVKSGLMLVSVMIAIAGIVWFFQPSLATIHRSIERNYQAVEHINADEFLLLDREDTVVFDVRESEEFAVSRLSGAIQLPPNLDPEEFREDYSEVVAGKSVVFYCSVGRRSSDMLARMSSVLNESGATQAANLEGGLFSWVNQQRPVQGQGIHPYNDYWGRLINDKSKISYSPPEATQ